MMDSLKRYLDEVRSLDGASLAVVVAATAATALGVSYLLLRHKPIMNILNTESQSIEMEDGSRGSRLVPKGTFQGSLYDDVSTLHEGFKRGLRVSDNGPCLGTIKSDRSGFDWLSYQEVYDAAQRLGSAFMQLGLTSHPGQDPQPENIIGIFSRNRAEWVMTEQAANMFSLVVVALYDTLGVEACQFIVNQAEMTIVICDNGAKVETILSFVENTPSLKQLIVMDIDTVTEEQKAKAEQFGVKIDSFKSTMEIGSEKMCKPNPPTPEEVATISYTSGTTGNPKGVMLTHANMINNSCGAHQISLSSKFFTAYDPKVDAYLSYLPLAHQYERVVQANFFMHGIKIGIFSGDVTRLFEEMQMLRPTIFPTVPRLLNRLCDKIKAGVHGSWFKTTLLNMALRSKTSEVERGIVRNDSIWDRLIFNKIQNILGGRVRMICVGSAPLSSSVLTFCRAAFGCHVIEGYGQTETTTCTTLTFPGEMQPGHVGPPIPNCLVKLVDVPDMKYYSREQKGEVCVKGNNVMLGYFKDPTKTAEAIDKDGWLHTGDIGEWTKEGTLKIIDRKKHIFKLAQGEYLAPEKIENIYTRSPLAAQAFVDGNSLRAFAVAVIVPEEEVIMKIAANNGLTGNMTELCQSQKLKQLIFEDIINEGKQAGLKSFEQVKDICLYPEMFSMENDLLTPTFKLKRPQARQFFKQLIDAMYEKRSD